jgi:hypothetical protein
VHWVHRKDIEHDEPELHSQIQFSVQGRQEALDAAVAEGTLREHTLAPAVESRLKLDTPYARTHTAPSDSPRPSSRIAYGSCTFLSLSRRSYHFGALTDGECI